MSTHDKCSTCRKVLRQLKRGRRTALDALWIITGADVAGETVTLTCKQCGPTTMTLFENDKGRLRALPLAPRALFFE